MASHEKRLRSLLGGDVHAVRVERIEGGYRVELKQKGLGATVDCGSRCDGIWSVVTSNGASFEVAVERGDSELTVSVGHSRFQFVTGALEPGRSRPASATGPLEVRSPMPGKIVRVLVAPGQSVAAGEPILLFEAMKMQNELRSPQDGIVARIPVVAGQAVEARETLYVLDPPRK